MFNEVKKRDEILTMSKRHMEEMSSKMEMTIKKFISGMLDMPVDFLELSDSKIVTVKEYVAKKGMLSVGACDENGFITLGTSEENASRMVRGAMGYKNRPAEGLSSIEASIYSSYMMPYVEELGEVLAIPMPSPLGRISLSGFNYSDNDYGLMKTYIAGVDESEIKLDLFISNSLVRKSLNGIGIEQLDSENLMIELIAEMYVKEVSLADIKRLKVGEIIDLPAPDSIQLRESISNEVITFGSYGEASLLKAVEINKI